MKWFKHMTGAHENAKKLMPLLRRTGVSGYGRYWLLLEFVGSQIEGDSGYIVTMCREDWGKILRTKSEHSHIFLTILSELELLTLECSGNDLTISIPKLLDIRDEYSKRSRQTPDKLPTNSRQTPDQIRLEQNRTEGDTEKTPYIPPKGDGIPYEGIINDLNEKSGKNYKSTGENTRKLIRARWSDGFRFEDFRLVHENMCAAWKGDKKMDRFLRPETLYAASKFDGYKNAKPGDEFEGL